MELSNCCALCQLVRSIQDGVGVADESRFGFRRAKGLGFRGKRRSLYEGRQLCQQLEENRELFPVLWHLCQLNIQRESCGPRANWHGNRSA